MTWKWPAGIGIQKQLKKAGEVICPSMLHFITVTASPIPTEPDLQAASPIPLRVCANQAALAFELVVSK